AACELGGDRRGLEIHVEHRDARAVVREPHRDRLAESGAAAGDDRDLSVQRHGTTTARPLISPSWSRRYPSTASSSRSCSTSTWIAPPRARATTSWSSDRVPQLGFESDHSSGTCPNAIGN